MEKRVEERDMVAERVALEPEEWALWLIPEWDELLVSALQLAASLLRARWCALYALDRHREGLLLARLWDEASGVVLGTRPAPTDGVEMQVARSGEAVTALRTGEDLLGSHSGNLVAVYPCACAPLELDGRRLGAVEVIRSPEGLPFRPADLATLKLVARHLVLSLRNSGLYRQLTQLAITDGLTGAYNFRYFQDRLEADVERASRYGRPLSLLMMDLNNFKSYNDRFGHQKGDIALQAVASIIQQTVRRIDLVARYGGDEFAVILPETTAFQASASGTRIALAVRDRIASGSPEAALEPLSVSIGISSIPDLASNKDELIEQADEALYRAKRSRVRTIRVWDPGWHGRPTLQHSGRQLT